jgi:arylsulfatase A-like enzyme
VGALQEEAGVRAFAAPPSRARLARGLATSAGLSVGLAAVLCKLASVGALAWTEIGRERLAAEATPAAVLAWFAPDALLGVGWGAGAGLLLGWFRGRVLVHSLLGLLHAAITLLLTGATLVYAAFGAPPTWGLLGNLGNLGDAKDSFVALVVGPPLTLLATLLLVVVAGTPLLDRLFLRRPRLARTAAIGGLALAAALGTTRALGRPSALELDRNGMVVFLRSAWVRRPAPPPVAGDLRQVLRPLAAPARPDARAAAAYRALAGWARARPRNVIIAILESMSAGQLQVTGGPVPNTPALLRLAGRGLLWPRHYAHTPNSMFALYALLGANHGLPGGASITETRPRIACRSLGEILTERGWEASLWHSGRFSYYKKDLFLEGRGFSPMHDAVTMPGAGDEKKTSWGIREEPTVDALLGWVRARPRNRPWLAVYISVYPHHPYDSPAEVARDFSGPGRLPRYRNAVEYVDRMVGRLWDGLRDAGVADDTLLLVLGDHGEGFGEHPGSTLHGTTLYDEGTRTFALWLAPVLLGPAVDDRPFGHVDVVPTLLDFMGIPVPAEHPGTPAPVVERPMVPLYTGNGVDHLGFVDGRWKFIHRARTGASELYDLAADPGERRSLAGLARDRVEAYRARADAFVAARAAWEARIPDLREGAPPPARIARTAERWAMDPATCEYSDEDFEVDGGTLRPRRSGFLTATCVRPVAAPGRVTELRVRGREAVNGSNLWVSLQWVGPDGTRREVAYCEMNGNTRAPVSGCDAVLVGGRTEFGPGGKLVAEVRYDLKGRPVPIDSYSVTEVEAGYLLDDGARR